MNIGTGVFVLRDEHTLVAMQAASFATENDFQRLLASFPELLAGDQIDTEVPRRFMLVAREKGIAAEEGGSDRWSLDHLFLDQDGIPTLVEVKRGTDTRIRREVVGQMLDYAANAVLHWPLDTLRAQFGARCEAEGRNPVETLKDLIGPDIEPETFWDGVRINLQAGRVRLLFVADKIPSELRRVVEFLNRQMQPAEVLAVELRQYEGQGLKTLVPIVLGRSEATKDRKSSPSRSVLPKRAWDEATVMAEIVARGDDAVSATARSIAHWMHRKADRIAFNTSPNFGALGAIFEVDGSNIPALRIFTDGTMAVYFEYMLGKPVFDALTLRQELLDRLNAVPGIRLPPDAVSKRKTIPLAGLTPPAVEAFLAAMDWFVDTLRSGAQKAEA
ncbi:hypothetical protein [Methylobacterium marchantiae]|uniref:DUF91 domain-containing protein n=1 Tax=Methylobacterium marchantiae TaxID=600331 RepID=A0ABW3X3I0_9HYPH|nr:hypothetical protein AIGOOFII_4190 [Methylobacterium marchantiae]